MPALWITIDDIDGKSVVKGPLYPDEIDTMGMLMRLSRGDIATITFTNASPLAQMKAKLETKPDV